MARAAATPAPGSAAVRTHSGAGLSSGSESPEERRSSRRDRSKKGRKEKRSKRSKRSRDREDRERERDRTSKKAKPTQDGKVSSSCRHHCQKGMGSPHCQAGILCSKTFERPLQDLGQGGKRTQAAKVSPSTAGVGTTLPIGWHMRVLGALLLLGFLSLQGQARQSGRLCSSCCHHRACKGEPLPAGEQQSWRTA